MPRKSLAIDEQLTDLARREAEVAQKRETMLVKAAIEKRPECVGMLCRSLRSHGYDLEAIAGASEKPKNVATLSRQEKAKIQRLEKLRGSTHSAAMLDMMSSEEGKKWVHQKYSELRDFSYQMILDMLLTPIASHVLTGANFRALKRKFPHAGTKEFLLKQLEYETGMPPEYKLTAEMRFWTFLQAVVQWRSYVRGRRSVTYGIVCAFGANGVYAKGDMSSTVTIMQRLAKEVGSIPLAELPRYENHEDLVIINNESETKARLISKSDALHDGVLLFPRFKNMMVNADMPEPKPPRAALEFTTSEPKAICDHSQGNTEKTSGAERTPFQLQLFVPAQKKRRQDCL